MAEIISVFDIENPQKTYHYDRADFYSEQVNEYEKSGKPSRGCEVVNVFLFTPEGEFFVQKRSAEKKHNPNLLDKTVGGHIVYGDNPEYTVMVETIQELQTPSIVLNTKEDFMKTLKLLSKYLETISVIQYVDTRVIELGKIIDEKSVVIANKSHVFFGVYNGKTRPIDRESKGVLLYSFDELKKEIEKSPEQFTNDFIFYLDEYKTQIENFLDIIKNNK